MHFAFTPQQCEFRDAVRQLLANECTTGDVRLAFEGPAARTARWTKLAAMGVVGLVPLLEESGRVALPEPLVETTALTAPLLAETGGADPAVATSVSSWLSGIAKGEVAAAVGGLSADPSSGQVAVAGATGAALLVLAAPGPRGPEIHVVGSDRVAVTPVASLDPTRRLGLLEWTPTPDTRVVSGPEAASAMVRTSDRAAVATAAQLLGLSDRMIGMAAEYAKGRHQFGKPIGSFQAVKHLLAGAQVRLEFARPVVYAAAWSLDEGEPNRSRAASTAKALASDAATEAARVSLQVHGAIGYTWECDLHLFLKRAWALAEAWGSASDHRQSVLASLAALP